jgi:hypothetical protein
MLYLYNECDTPQWRLDKGHDDNHYRLTLIANEKFGIPITVDDGKFDEDRLSSTNDGRNVQRIFSGKTAMRFSSRNLHPAIVESRNKFNSDIYLVSYNLEPGFELINQLRNQVYIYFQYYDPENQQLHMLLSFNTKKKGSHPYVQDVLVNEEAGMVHMKHMFWSEKYGNVSVILNETSIEKAKQIKRGQRGYIDLTDRRKNGEQLKLENYIPMRPTRLVVVDNEQDVESLKNLIENKYNIPADYTNYFIMGADEKKKESLRELKKYTNAGKDTYTAVTYFISKYNYDEMKEHIKDVSNDIDNNKLGKHFKIRLAMSSDGRIRRIR